MNPWYEGTLDDIVAHLITQYGVVQTVQAVSIFCGVKADAVHEQADPKEWRLWDDRQSALARAVQELKYG